MLEDGRRVKLTDFGTAAHIDDIVSSVSRLNGVTPHFTAPEVSNLSVYLCIFQYFSEYSSNLFV